MIEFQCRITKGNDRMVLRLYSLNGDLVLRRSRSRQAIPAQRALPI